jgi:predicted CoA-binding protein
MSADPVAPDPYADPAVIERLLDEAQVWAVVGLRDDPRRAAWGVARWLLDHGKTVVPVHPAAEVVHGCQGVRTLDEVPYPIDVADMFVNSGLVGPVVDQAVVIGARAVWLQLDVIDVGAVARAAAAGLDVVMDRCPAIEGRRLGR